MWAAIAVAATPPRPRILASTSGNHYRMLSAIAASTIAATPPRPQFDIGGTSGFTRGLVSSLTAVVNALGGNTEDEAPPRTRAFDTLTSAMVLDGLRRDFVENEYLWSGRITPELYDEDCVFTDPTLTFSGLSTFEANLANLDPYIERFVPPAGRAVELDSLELADDGAVEARWRMVGDIAVPWKPRLDLRGCTRYTLGGDGGRIVRYDESWAITPAEALLQLVRPR